MKTTVKNFCFASIIHFLITIFPLSGFAQDLRETGLELEAEEKWMTALYTLESTVHELMFHHSMAILASYGNYNSQERADGSTNGTDFTRFFLRINYHEASLGAFKRTLLRGAQLSADDLNRAEIIVRLYGEFLLAARAVASSLQDGNVHAANLAFRDGSVPLSKALIAELYTLRRLAQDRFHTSAIQFH